MMIDAVFILFYVMLAHGRKKEANIIYMLLGTPRIHLPLTIMTLGRQAFISRNCTYQNCYVTDDESYLDDVTDFDAVIFNGLTLRREPLYSLSKRSENQKYIYCSKESSANEPIALEYNGYFNWTWTYKLDSDIPSPYMAVRNSKNEIIGPQIEMQWINANEMKPIETYVENKLRNKKIAAAWYVSNCETNRSMYVAELKEELSKYGHRVDIYGACGNLSCDDSKDSKECYAVIERDYYFYLAFENSFSVDYVTEKLLTALQHFSVPVVYGGANYSRFMPQGIYLDALVLGPQKLAKKMNALINDKEKYQKYFRWHGYYSFYDPFESPDTKDFCVLCAVLNNKQKLNERKVYEDIVSWFNEPKDWSKNVKAVKPTEEKPNVASKVVAVIRDMLNYMFAD